VRWRGADAHAAREGEKLFLLWSPWDLPHLSPRPRREGALNNQSALGSALCRSPAFWPPAGPPPPAAQLAEVAAAAAAAGRASCLFALVRAPDAIYIPNGWWHEVLTPQWAVSFNTWFRSTPQARLRPTKLYCFSAEYEAFVHAQVHGPCL
jgi:hypothetical protein